MKKTKKISITDIEKLGYDVTCIATLVVDMKDHVFELAREITDTNKDTAIQEMLNQVHRGITDK